MDDVAGADPPAQGSSRIAEIVRLFLRLGVVGFGGPAAHVALMRDEVVRRRGWMDDAEFLDHVGATALVPGPNSTELAMVVGERRAGRWGLVAAGVAFILPSVAIVAVLAWAYRRFGTDPTFVDLRYGLLPVVTAIVAHALGVFIRVVSRSPFRTALAGLAFLAYVVGAGDVVILVAGGVVSTLVTAARGRRPMSTSILAVPVVAAAMPPEWWRLLAVFLRIGATLFGSGYVLVALLERSVVDDRGWITSAQLLDAVTVGQVTPGPLFSTATFVGWQIDGPVGAVVATVGIFAPSFVIVAALGPFVRWIRRRPLVAAFVAGVTAASLGAMAGALVDLAVAAFVDPWAIVLGVAALVVLVRTRVDPTLLIAVGAAVGVARLVLL